MGTLERHLGKHGYSLVKPVQTLCANDFGVPQSRERVFILGHRNGLLAPEYPVPTFSSESDGAQRCPTVWDAIGDLPNVDDYDELVESEIFAGELLPARSDYARILRGELEEPRDLARQRERNGNGLTGCRRTQHTEAVVGRFEATVPGTREVISRFPRLKRDGLCPTLRAGTDSSRGGHMAVRPIHPDFARCITVREGARLHSFPDWFQFHSTKWRAFMQIGNSVPPLLVRAVASKIQVVIEA